MVAWLVALLAVSSAAAVVVTWRARRVADAVKVGAILGVATFAVFHAAAIVRVNVY